MRPESFMRNGLVAIVLMTVTGASAAYFHESRRDGMLWASDPALKQKFVVDQAVPVSMLPSAEATRVVAAPPAQGLYEQDGGIRMPNGRCEGDEAKIQSCTRKWESGNLAKAKGAAVRKGGVLTLSPAAGAKVVFTDWEKCSPEGECDGENFIYLGALPRSGALAVEIDYGHDSPSLVLVDPKSGQIAVVHYGSEPTFLNGPQTLLVSSEDMNDVTTLLVTRLDGGGPSIDLQCLGARTESSSFGVMFKRWTSDAAFDLVLVKAGQTTAAHFERSADGAWTLKSPSTVEGFECRQRAAPAATTPRPS
jgi:hypothetical protein